jgi:hypothetical protein
VWQRLHEVLLAELNAAARLDRSRAVVDSSHVRALKGGSTRAPRWLGEAEGLQVSLQAASKKLTAMDQARARSKTHIADLGLPQLRQP